MNYQCDVLEQYVDLWLTHTGEPVLRREIIQHRESCSVCMALREATIERRKLQRTADIHSEIPIQFSEQTSERLATIMRRLYTIITPGPGDIGWVHSSDSASGGGDTASIRIDSTTGDMAGSTAGGG